MYKILKFRLASLAITVFVAVQLVACSGGGRGGDGGSAAAEDGPLQISGSVGGGPLVGATVTASSSSGRQIGSIVSKNDASYRTNIRAKSKDYPLLLSVNDGFDLVTGSAPDFTMSSVVMIRKQESANINPFSTLIVKIARLKPGGINTDNINIAKGYVTEQLGFGLDHSVIDDPVATRITDANAANLIRASEALSEMVRRTRDTISADGTAVTADDVVDAIAADMIDGYLDGTGAAAVNPSVSTVARVVSAQVLVEALNNELRVGGIVATGVIEQAIAMTRPGASSFRMTDEERIPADVLNLAAVRVPDASPAVSGIVSVVNTVPVNSSQNGDAEVLPAGTSAMADAAVTRSASVLNEEAAVNQGVHAGDTGDSGSGDTGGAGSGPANTVPVINGTPAGSVQANASYAFQPKATDADGNMLAFSIANKPDWASFSDTTGRLIGTPADGDNGAYNNIVISVTDGLDTASLPAFDIQVDAATASLPAFDSRASADPVPAESYTLSWKASVALPDDTPQSLAEHDDYRNDGNTSTGSPDGMTMADGSTGSARMSPDDDYVVMTAYDAAGYESADSAEITRSAQ